MSTVRKYILDMKYGNALIKEYPNSNLVNVAVFNRLIVNDYSFKLKHFRDKETLSEKELEFNAIESDRISRQRALHKIFDIAMLNDWQYFVTFTFNDKIQDAHDYDGSIKKVKKWCNNQVQRYGIRYLLVPELHPTSGRVHLHGLLYYPVEPPLTFSGHYDKSLRPIYNLPLWRFGFSTVVKLDDNTLDRTARYITKYITKEIGKITGNYYYAGGHDLKRDCDKQYVNVSYDEFDAPAINIKDGLYVKYLLMTKEDALKLQFCVDETIDF